MSTDTSTETGSRTSGSKTRTTVTLDDDLLREARGRAARSGHTLSEVIQDAVRDSFIDGR